MKKAGDILKSVLGDGEAQHAQEWASFFGAWSVIAGEDLAAHSKVIDVRRGTALVEVDHPGWMQIFQLKHSSILKAIKKRYPELDVEDIRCYLKSKNDSPSAANKPRRNIPPQIDESTQEYKEFKNLLERLKKQGRKTRGRA